jgi:drug/metabolite transporter (DMT)-like permease
VVALLVVAWFAPAALKGKGALLLRHAGLLFVLTLTGAALFQTFVYVGLQSTTAINAVLLNASAPLFMVLCSWVLERETASGRQIAGMLISWVGIFIIIARGDAGNLLRMEFHSGDAWILIAMPIWGTYSVLLKRLPPELRGTTLLFVLCAGAVPLLLPAVLLEAASIVRKPLTTEGVIGLAYMGVFASVGAFICWNRAVAVVGANVAGFSIPLLPVFGTVLAMVFLGEQLFNFHLLGIATILFGVVLATRPAA